MHGIVPLKIAEVFSTKYMVERFVRIIVSIIFLSRGLHTLYQVQVKKLRKAYALFICIFLDIVIACAFLLLPTELAFILVVLIVLVQILYKKGAA